MQVEALPGFFPAWRSLLDGLAWIWTDLPAKSRAILVFSILTRRHFVDKRDGSNNRFSAYE